MKLLLGLMMISAAAIQGETREIMKLVNSKTGFVVVAFKEGKAEFFDRFLEAELLDRGIYIPPSKADQFDGMRVVFPGDPLFEKAFAEIYCPLTIANSDYEWQTD